MAWFTADELKTQIAAALGVAGGGAALEAKWNDIVPLAILEAQSAIYNYLTARGYTRAEVDAWQDLREYHASISYFFALSKGGGLLGYDDKFIKSFDRRPELATVVVTQPQADPGPIGFGKLKSDSDVFSMDTQW